MTSLLSDLRASTASLHEALDRKIEMRPATLTRKRYAAFLRGSLGAVEPLEIESQRWLPARDAVSRAARIRADLSGLGEDPENASVPMQIADVTSEGAAMGVAYVLEGSTLGGMFMAKMVDETLGLNGSSLGYLTFRGQQTQTAWRSFLADLDAWARSAAPDAHADACAAAEAAFDAYARSFERAGAFGDST